MPHLLCIFPACFNPLKEVFIRFIYIEVLLGEIETVYCNLKGIVLPSFTNSHAFLNLYEFLDGEIHTKILHEV